MVTFEEVIINFRTNLRMVQLNLSATGKEAAQLDKNLHLVTRRWARLGTQMRQSIISLKRFRMEMLGVLFFGMVVSQMFQNMLTPAANALGIFELFSLMLMVLFLPILIEIYPYLLRFVKWVVDLDPRIQMLIGVFVLFGLILFKVLHVIGVLVMGFSSLMQAGMATYVIKLIAWFVKFVGTVAGLGSAFLGLASLVAILLFSMWDAWKRNFNRMRDWAKVFVEGQKKIWGGMRDYLVGIMDVVKGVFTLDLEKIKEGFTKIFTGIRDMIVGAFQSVLAALVMIGTGILNIFARIFGWIWDKMVSLANKVLEVVPDIPGIGKITSKIGSFVQGTGVGDFATGLVINQTNNISATTHREIERMIEENNKKLVDQVSSASTG